VLDTLRRIEGVLRLGPGGLAPNDINRKVLSIPVLPLGTGVTMLRMTERSSPSEDRGTDHLLRLFDAEKLKDGDRQVEDAGVGPGDLL
jgi:hypothetical protein